MTTKKKKKEISNQKVFKRKITHKTGPNNIKHVMSSSSFFNFIYYWPGFDFIIVISLYNYYYYFKNHQPHPHTKAFWYLLYITGPGPVELFDKTPFFSRNGQVFPHLFVGVAFHIDQSCILLERCRYPHHHLSISYSQPATFTSIHHAKRKKRKLPFATNPTLISIVWRIFR